MIVRMQPAAKRDGWSRLMSEGRRIRITGHVLTFGVIDISGGIDTPSSAIRMDDTASDIKRFAVSSIDSDKLKLMPFSVFSLHKRNGSLNTYFQIEQSADLRRDEN